jgi:hypothetical protein
MFSVGPTGKLPSVSYSCCNTQLLLFHEFNLFSQPLITINGTAMLNVSQCYHHSKDNENQLAAAEWKDLSFTLAIIFNALNISVFVRVLFNSVRFQVLMAANTKMTVCWDLAPCSLVAVYRRFGGAYCSHYQDGEKAARLTHRTEQHPRRQLSSCSLLFLSQFHWVRIVLRRCNISRTIEKE